MLERLDVTDRALLVQPEGSHHGQAGGHAEFQELARSAGVEPALSVHARGQRPDPATFIGSGKVAEIKELLAEHQLQLVLVNHALTPGQERNLERELNARVLDRTTLILDIFAQRALTHEGKLQVELAQLRHLSTRLVRGWTHLERQKGGIGLRGPGETQLETDRRLINGRIRHLRARLDKVQRRRALNRRSRQRNDVPLVALVGYTNAGKSTLFNALTGSETEVADRLFATLDPTLRRLQHRGSDMVLSDTVGFVRQLPHELVAAFRATLEEVRQADLLVHVVDSANPERAEHIEQVNAVLEEIGAQEVPRVLVYNKIDLTDAAHRVEHRDDQGSDRVWVSAGNGAGLELLKETLEANLARERMHRHIELPPRAGKLHARLHALGAVLEENTTSEGGWRMEVSLPRRQAEELVAMGGDDGRLSRQMF